MKKSFPLRLSEEEMQIVKSEAAGRGMTINSYIKSLLPATSSAENPISSLRIKLSDEDKELLNLRASEAGMTVTDFIHDILHKKAFVNLTVGVSDLHELLEAINNLSKKLSGIVTIFQSSGKAYDQDVKAIIEIFRNIDTTCTKFYMEEREERRSLYKEARKKLFCDIKQNDYKKVLSQ